MKNTLAAAGVFGGFTAAALFLFIYGALGVTELMLLPSLPLYGLGLRYGFRPLAVALLVAMLLISGFSSPFAGIFFLFFLGLPVLLFAPLALSRPQRSSESDGSGWLATGRILTDLTVYAALVFGVLMAHHSAEGGMRAVFQAQLREALAGFDAEPKARLEAVAAQWSFVMLALGAWWWVILLYAHALLANWLLFQRKASVRASLALRIFQPPGWLLALLVVSAAGTALPDAELAFDASVIFCIFLLPYFFLGISIAHFRVKDWPNRGPVLFALYFSVLALALPALLLALLGIWRHCRSLPGAKNAGT